MTTKRAPDHGADQRPPTPPARPSRGRPPVISSDKLLDVAREVFLEHGIRATTLEVAQRAGVSEGVVFHRFKSKDALFRQAMQHTDTDIPRLVSQWLHDLEGVEIREALHQLASKILEVGRIAVPLIMMAWSNPERRACMATDENRAGYHQMLRALAGFFQAKMNNNELRRMDAEIFTRAFMGPLHHYCMTQLVAPEHRLWTLPEGMFVRGLVELLLTGAEPSNDHAERPASRRRIRG